MHPRRQSYTVEFLLLGALEVSHPDRGVFIVHKENFLSVRRKRGMRELTLCHQADFARLNVDLIDALTLASTDSDNKAPVWRPSRLSESAQRLERDFPLL